MKHYAKKIAQGLGVCLAFTLTLSQCSSLSVDSKGAKAEQVIKNFTEIVNIQGEFCVIAGKAARKQMKSAAAVTAIEALVAKAAQAAKEGKQLMASLSSSEKERLMAYSQDPAFNKMLGDMIKKTSDAEEQLKNKNYLGSSALQTACQKFEKVGQ